MLEILRLKMVEKKFQGRSLLTRFYLTKSNTAPTLSLAPKVPCRTYPSGNLTRILEVVWCACFWTFSNSILALSRNFEAFSCSARKWRASCCSAFSNSYSSVIAPPIFTPPAIPEVMDFCSRDLTSSPTFFLISAAFALASRSYFASISLRNWLKFLFPPMC